MTDTHTDRQNFKSQRCTLSKGLASLAPILYTFFVWTLHPTIAFWQRSCTCIFTRFCRFYCCELINPHKVRKCLMLTKHSSNTVHVWSSWLNIFRWMALCIFSHCENFYVLYFYRHPSEQWPSSRWSCIPSPSHFPADHTQQCPTRLNWWDPFSPRTHQHAGNGFCESYKYRIYPILIYHT